MLAGHPNCKWCAWKGLLCVILIPMGGISERSLEGVDQLRAEGLGTEPRKRVFSLLGPACKLLPLSFPVRLSTTENTNDSVVW